MADISMCGNFNCPKKADCYRFNAIPSEYRQTYGMFEYKDGKCDHFWEMNHKPSKQL